MLALYLSTIVTTQAYMASRKVALVSRALADIASRQSPCASTTPNPCVLDADISMFFKAAASIMSPYPTTTLKMTISRIDIVQDTSVSKNNWAFTKWSVVNSTTGANAAIARPCNGLNPAFVYANYPNAASMTNSTTKPLGAADMSVTASGYQNYLQTEYTVAGAPTGVLIVADVIYTYTPGFTFNIFNWTNVTAITTGWSQGFWSRTALPIIGSTLTLNGATVCSQNNPGEKASWP